MRYTGFVFGLWCLLCCGFSCGERQIELGCASTKDCQPNEQCVQQRCKCLQPYVVCGGACVSLSSSIHCGDCGISCLGEQLCFQGTCCSPTEEICDNQDNDCDGKVDEGVVRSCYEGTPQTKGVGLCKQGVQHCEKGYWVPDCVSQILPLKQESCRNQEDEDCDGKIDESCVWAVQFENIKEYNISVKNTSPRGDILLNIYRYQPLTDEIKINTWGGAAFPSVEVKNIVPEKDFGTNTIYRLNSDGRLLWKKTLPHPNYTYVHDLVSLNGMDTIALLGLGSGSTLVEGMSYQTVNRSLLLIKFDSLGKSIQHIHIQAYGDGSYISPVRIFHQKEQIFLLMKLKGSIQFEHLRSHFADEGLLLLSLNLQGQYIWSQDLQVNLEADRAGKQQVGFVDSDGCVSVASVARLSEDAEKEIGIYLQQFDTKGSALWKTKIILGSQKFSSLYDLNKMFTSSLKLFLLARVRNNSLFPSISPEVIIHALFVFDKKNGNLLNKIPIRDFSFLSAAIGKSDNEVRLLGVVQPIRTPFEPSIYQQNIVVGSEYSSIWVDAEVHLTSQKVEVSKMKPLFVSKETFCLESTPFFILNPSLFWHQTQGAYLFCSFLGEFRTHNNFSITSSSENPFLLKNP